jgi:hypothetical protein
MKLDWMDDEEEEEDNDPSSGQYSDSSCNDEDVSTAQDESAEEDDPATVLQSTGMAPAAAGEGVAEMEADSFMLHSPLYPPLLSEYADEDEMVGLNLAAVDSAPAIGPLCDSVEHAMEVGPVVPPAAASVFLSRPAPSDSPLLSLEQDEGVDRGFAASSVACATVDGSPTGSSSPLPFDSSTAGIYGRDVRINHHHTPPMEDTTSAMRTEE